MIKIKLPSANADGCGAMYPDKRIAPPTIGKQAHYPKS